MSIVGFRIILPRGNVLQDVIECSMNEKGTLYDIIQCRIKDGLPFILHTTWWFISSNIVFQSASLTRHSERTAHSRGCSITYKSTSRPYLLKWTTVQNRVFWVTRHGMRRLIRITLKRVIHLKHDSNTSL
jgi:hypothetical protein